MAEAKIDDAVLERLILNIGEANEGLGIAHDTCNDSFEVLQAGEITLQQCKKLFQQLLKGEPVTMPPQLMDGMGNISKAAYAEYNGEEYEDEEDD